MKKSEIRKMIQEELLEGKSNWEKNRKEAINNVVSALKSASKVNYISQFDKTQWLVDFKNGQSALIKIGIYNED